MEGFTLIQDDHFDIRFGYIKVFWNKDVQEEMIFSKTKIAQSSAEFQYFINESKTRHQLNQDFLINHKHFNENSEQLSVTNYFFYPNCDLNSRQEFFNDPIEICQFINDMLQVTSYLEKNEILHGNLRPELIFYDKLKEKYILIDNFFETKNLVNIHLNYIKNDDLLFISEEIFEEIVDPATRKSIRFSFKSECFSIGLIVIYMLINIDSYRKLYDIEKKVFSINYFWKIKEFITTQLLANPKMNFLSSFLFDVLLNLEQESRLTPVQAVKVFKSSFLKSDFANIHYNNKKSDENNKSFDQNGENNSFSDALQSPTVIQKNKKNENANSFDFANFGSLKNILTEGNIRKEISYAENLSNYSSENKINRNSEEWFIDKKLESQKETNLPIEKLDFNKQSSQKKISENVQLFLNAEKNENSDNEQKKDEQVFVESNRKLRIPSEMSENTNFFDYNHNKDDDINFFKDHFENTTGSAKVLETINNRTSERILFNQEIMDQNEYLARVNNVQIDNKINQKNDANSKISFGNKNDSLFSNKEVKSANKPEFISNQLSFKDKINDIEADQREHFYDNQTSIIEQNPIDNQRQNLVKVNENVFNQPNPISVQTNSKEVQIIKINNFCQTSLKEIGLANNFTNEIDSMKESLTNTIDSRDSEKKKKKKNLEFVQNQSLIFNQKLAFQKKEFKEPAFDMDSRSLIRNNLLTSNIDTLTPDMITQINQNLYKEGSSEENFQRPQLHLEQAVKKLDATYQQKNYNLPKEENYISNDLSEFEGSFSKKNIENQIQYYPIVENTFSNEKFAESEKNLKKTIDSNKKEERAHSITRVDLNREYKTVVTKVFANPSQWRNQDQIIENTAVFEGNVRIIKNPEKMNQKIVLPIEKNEILPTNLNNLSNNSSQRTRFVNPIDDEINNRKLKYGIGQPVPVKNEVLRENVPQSRHVQRISPPRNIETRTVESNALRNDSSNLNPRIIKVSRSPVIIEDKNQNKNSRFGENNWSKALASPIDERKFTSGTFGEFNNPTNVPIVILKSNSSRIELPIKKQYETINKIGPVKTMYLENQHDRNFRN